MANLFDAGAVDEVLTLSARLLDAHLLLEVEVVGHLTDGDAVSSLELVTRLARGELANSSVPSGVGRTSVYASSSDHFLVFWAVKLHAVTINLLVSFLAVELETGSSEESVTSFTGNSSASLSDELEVLWTANFVASVASSDLTGWASHLVADGFTLDSLSLVTSWTFNTVANSVFFDLSGFTFLSFFEFFVFVAFVANSLVTVRALDGVLDDFLDASLSDEFESVWTGDEDLVVSFDALTASSVPALWTILDAELVLVVGVSAWAGVGDSPLLLPFSVAVLPSVFEVLLHQLLGDVGTPAVLQSLFGEVLPAWVVLDHVLH